MDNTTIINKLLGITSRRCDLKSEVFEHGDARQKLTVLHLSMRVLFMDDLAQEFLTDKVFNKAYKVIALRIHPDKNADNADNATAAFKKLQTALEILNLALELHDDEMLKEALTLEKKEIPSVPTSVPAAPSGAAAGGGAAASREPPQAHYYDYRQHYHNIPKSCGGTAPDCTHCGSSRHTTDYCRMKQSQVRRCYCCGDPSHLANLCPLRRAAGGSAAAAAAYPQLCRNGKECRFHKQGRCKYGHPE